MGACASVANAATEPHHPAVNEPWPLKEEATRIFKLADVDGNGNLDMSELQDIMKNPQFVSSAMEHLDLNLDGCVSLREWLISMKTTFDKSEAACKTALKMHEKAITMAKEKKAQAQE